MKPRTSQPTYNGKPCKKCGETEKFVDKKQGYCVACKQAARERSRNRARDSERKYGYKNSLEDREKFLKLQNGLCSICKNPPQGKKGLALDHCHTTKKNRGLLCSMCNIGLGHFKDDINRIIAAANYLKTTS